MKEVSFTDFKLFIKNNNLNGKGKSVAISEPALVIFEIDDIIVAKVELPNQFSKTNKYFLLINE